MGNDRQHMDNYMKVEHASPRCESRQVYKGILDGQSHGVFHGRIIVHKDAQKTDAKQTNMNLLLSEDAQIDTKPQLEIYADDVKCTHGRRSARSTRKRSSTCDRADSPTPRRAHCSSTPLRETCSSA